MTSIPSAGVDAGAGAYRVRPAWAEVDLAAIRHNASVLAALAAPAHLCAVVKAGGYGHGAVEVARAALSGGAHWLAVALVEEGRELREAGISAPVLVLSEPPAEAMAEVVTAGLTPTIYTRPGLAALRQAVVKSTATGPFPVHIKADTGMHRVGATAEAAVELAAEVAADPALALEGFWTHLAVSDEVENPFNNTQFDRYDAALDQLAGRGLDPGLRHTSNSGGALWHPRGRYDMVRCGISLYGYSPAIDGPSIPDLRPVMSLKARVSFVKEVVAGERLSYGLRYTVPVDSVVATIPLGYADGVPRRLSAEGGDVLIGGLRRPMSGTVTMDQILVDCGPGARVNAGDEVVLIGRQGDQVIDAWEWARATGTIAYEVVCGISGRVPRVYIHGSWHRALSPAGLVGAGLVTGVAAWTAVNRAAVRRLSRQPDPIDPNELQMPADLVEHTLTMSDGWVIRAVERGPKDGVPVVLLHGITLAASVWPYQLAALADAGLRVVAVDLRGHGLSGGAAAPDEGTPPASSMTLDRTAADVSEVLEQLDLTGAILVGHSMGGMVTLKLLGADPDLAAGQGRVAGLVLVATTANATRRRGFPGLSDLVAVAQPVLSSVSGLAARLPGPTLPANDLAYLLARVTFGDDSSSKQVSFTGHLTSDVPVRVSAELLLEILRFNAEGVLPWIRLPTTVVVGDHDLMTPQPQAEFLAAHIRGAELAVLPGCGHMVMLERPDELNRLIQARAAG